MNRPHLHPVDHRVVHALSTHHHLLDFAVPSIACCRGPVLEVSLDDFHEASRLVDVRTTSMSPVVDMESLEDHACKMDPPAQDNDDDRQARQASFEDIGRAYLCVDRTALPDAERMVLASAHNHAPLLHGAARMSSLELPEVVDIPVLHQLVRPQLVPLDMAAYQHGKRRVPELDDKEKLQGQACHEGHPSSEDRGAHPVVALAFHKSASPYHNMMHGLVPKGIGVAEAACAHD